MYGIPNPVGQEGVTAVYSEKEQYVSVCSGNSETTLAIS